MLKALIELIIGFLNHSKYNPRVIIRQPRKIDKMDVINANPLLFNNKMLEWQNFTWIIEHHSATRDGKVNDTAGIKKYHMSYRIDHNIVSKKEFMDRVKKGDGKVFQKPWRDIGYNATVEESDNCLQVFAGRSLAMTGGHSKTWNDKAVGLCLIGCYSHIEPSPEKYELLAITTKKFMKALNIPIQNVIGHGEANARAGLPYKDCPGAKFDMTKFQKIVQSISDTTLIHT